MLFSRNCLASLESPPIWPDSAQFLELSLNHFCSCGPFGFPDSITIEPQRLRKVLHDGGVAQQPLDEEARAPDRRRGTLPGGRPGQREAPLSPEEKVYCIIEQQRAQPALEAAEGHQQLQFHEFSEQFGIKGWDLFPLFTLGLYRTFDQ